MKKITFFDIALILLSLLLCLGTAFIFHPCGPKEDGSWMLCHWAGNVIVAMGAAFSAASIARLFLPKEIKTGISITFIPFAIISLLVTGLLVKMCMMHDMRCWVVMRPSVVILSVLIIIISIVDIIVAAVKK